MHHVVFLFLVKIKFYGNPKSTIINSSSDLYNYGSIFEFDLAIKLFYYSESNID